MRFLLLSCCLFLAFGLWAQESDSSSVELFEEEKTKKVVFSGYLKNMQSLYAIDSLNPLLTKSTFFDNLIHHRLNFSWYINENFTFKADMRTRIFIGETVKMTYDFGGDYSETLDTNNIKVSGPNYKPSQGELIRDLSGLSFTWLNRRSIVIHSKIDRLYLDFTKGNWEVRLGRQRINWGIGQLWNSNDIFNAYSFTDFDYEERPGSDALRVKYYMGYASSVEVAINVFNDWRKMTAGMLWKFNKWNYDFQLLTGITRQTLAFGGGWAGNIKGAGFNGEFAYFYSLDSTVAARHSFTGSLGIDYSFSNSMYLTAGLMYNSNGVTQGGIADIFTFQLSAQNLYPYRYSSFLTVSYPFTPVFSGALSAIYSPGESHALFLSPILTFSIKENWDIDFISQIAFNKDGKKYKSPMQLFFLRLKFSY